MPMRACCELVRCQPHLPRHDTDLRPLLDWCACDVPNAMGRRGHACDSQIARKAAAKGESVGGQARHV